MTILLTLLCFLALRNDKGGLTLFSLGFLRLPGLGGGEAGVPAAYNSKTINDIEIRFGGVVENHKRINLV